MPRQSRRSLPRRRLRTRHHERCRDKHVAHPQTEAVGHTSFYVNHSIGVMNLSGSSHDTRPCGANTNLLCLDIFMPRCSLECVHHSKSLSVWSHSSVRRSWRSTLPFHKPISSVASIMSPTFSQSSSEFGTSSALTLKLGNMDLRQELRHLILTAPLIVAPYYQCMGGCPFA